MGALHGLALAWLESLTPELQDPGRGGQGASVPARWRLGEVGLAWWGEWSIQGVGTFVHDQMCKVSMDLKSIP